MQLKSLAQHGRDRATRLFLVRHGQVADGHTDKYHGKNDIELSPTGLRQFEVLAQRLAPLAFQAIYSSPLTRCRRGAELIARGRNLPVAILPALRELDFGHWEGLSFSEIAARYPDELDQRLRDLTGFRIPQGESLTDVQARVLPTLEEVVARHPGEQICIVAHAGINRVILCQAMGMPLQNIFHLDQSYAGLNVIDYFSDFTVVRLLNVTLPLPFGIQETAS